MADIESEMEGSTQGQRNLVLAPGLDWGQADLMKKLFYPMAVVLFLVGITMILGDFFSENLKQQNIHTKFFNAPIGLVLIVLSLIPGYLGGADSIHIKTSVAEVDIKQEENPDPAKSKAQSEPLISESKGGEIPKGATVILIPEIKK